SSATFTPTPTFTPAATPTIVVPTATPVPIFPTNTPVILNPLDLDGDGVLHDPDNGFYDLCEDAVGNPGTCGCPPDNIPSTCGGGGGGGDGFSTVTPVPLP
ncbi:MAG: hypothetical protein AAF633_22910, partial [Chloroflexota bacterium]